jgi:hypothetical protein
MELHMSGRRRHQRFAVNSLVTGILEVLEDVPMESREDGQFVVTTTAPVTADQLTLHVTGPTGTRSIRVRVVESQLHVAQDGVRYRVRLASIDDVPAAADSEKTVVE